MSAATGPVDYATLDDVGLIRLITDRDPDALEALYLRYGPTCYRVARRVTRNEALAEDTVQEVYLGLWQRPHRFDSGSGQLGSWLLAMSHHKAVDFVRRETSQQRRQAAAAAELPSGLGPAAPDAAAWQTVQAEGVRAAVGLLSEPQRRTVALAYYGGYTQREIAALMGVPLGTVKTRMFAAMRVLRRALSAVADRQGEAHR